MARSGKGPTSTLGGPSLSAATKDSQIAGIGGGKEGPGK